MTFRPEPLVVALFASLGLVPACDAVCPAAFEPSANPVGLPCTTNDDCEVECVCQDANGEERGVLAGECNQNVCEDADDVCDGACGARTYAGKYCETRR